MIAVCDISALARWAEKGLLERLGDPCAHIEARDWSLASADSVSHKDLRAARLEARPERPLHVLVSSRDRRVRAKSLCSHVWSAVLPEGSFYQLTDTVLLASPEFCLRQMAPRSSTARIALVGTEICGCYGRTPHAPDGFYKRDPLATPESLEKSLMSMTTYGSCRAARDLSFVVSGSRSPMETVVLLVFMLPIELGGCGFPPPLLNCRIDIPASLQLALGKPYLVVDLCWPQWLIVLEYDSYDFHTAPRQVDDDNVRDEGLRDLGWMVRSVTSGMLTNDAMLKEMADRVADRMGVSLPNDEDYLARRHALVRELLCGP